jgi:diketogulonate reductase-like aldo/keto reductase
MSAFEKLVEDGIVKFISLSNFKQAVYKRPTKALRSTRYLQLKTITACWIGEMKILWSMLKRTGLRFFLRIGENIANLGTRRNKVQ